MIINLSKIDFGGIATGGKSKPEETFDVQPTTAEQTITPTEGSVFSGGTVRAVTSAIDNNIVAGNIKEGVTILGVGGTLKEGITPTGTIAINLNGTYDVTNYASAEVNVGDTPDYRYAKGTVDKAGLKAIGWTDEDILTYEQNKAPHYVWQNDQFKVSEENKALYLLDDPNPDSYKSNPNITFVPNKNMEIYFAKSSSFENMKYIKGIPFFDISNTTSMNSIFHNCSSLKSIPQLDTSNVTDMGGMFISCTSLTTIPQLNTSNATSMNGMFQNCSSLSSIPLLDTSNVTDMSYMFNNCSNLTTIPQLNTSKVTNIYGMFGNCSSLTTIPQLDTSKVTNMMSLFQNCSSLSSIPLLDTSNVTDMSWMFANSDGNYELTSIPQLDTSNVTNMSWMFQKCMNLTSIPQLNTSKVTDMGNMFWQCYNLTTVEGFDFSGLTSNPESFFGYYSEMPNLTRFIVNGKINVSMGGNSISALTAIDYDSVKSILAAADRTDNTNAKELAFNRTMTDQNGELAALVSSCTTKGWTITGLTLQ